MSKTRKEEIDYEGIEERIKIKELTVEVDTPEGIVSFLQKRNGIYNFDFRNRYSVTDLVNCHHTHSTAHSINDNSFPFLSPSWSDISLSVSHSTASEQYFHPILHVTISIVHSL